MLSAQRQGGNARSYNLKISPLRISHRNHNPIHLHQTSLVHRPRRSFQRRRRRNDIIHQRHAFSAHALLIHQSKRKPQIRSPIGNRSNNSLRSRIFQSYNRISNPQRRPIFRKPPRQTIRLVIPPQNLPRPMQRNRHQHIRLIKQRPHPRKLQHPIRQNLHHRPSMAILHPKNRFPQRLPISPQRNNPGKRINPLPRASRTSTPLGHRQSTPLTRMRIRKTRKRYRAGRTKRPLIRRPPATNTAGGVNKICDIL
jgi:hypothetical protein